MANRNFANGGRIYSPFVSPVLIDCNFVVSSTSPNGILNLKGPLVARVQLQGLTPNPTPAPGSPTLLTSATYAVLGASTVTNTGNTVVTGDLGLSPGTSVTGFPPGTVSGTQHITDAAAAQAQLDATAAYLDLQSRGGAITIVGNLAGQTLLPGVYKSSTSIDLSVGGTLTLDAGGDPNALWIFQAGSTVTLHNSSTVLIINGGSAQNVYWQVGSSATIGTSAVALGTFIAQASVTAQTSASISGRLMALTGAVTLDDNAVTVTGPSGPTHIPGTPAPGTIVVQFQDNYNRLLKGFKQIQSPGSLLPLKIDNSALTPGAPYIIEILGDASAATWHALGVPPGVTPALGVSFIAASNGGSANVSSSRVMAPAPLGSAILSIETVGDPNLSIAPNPRANQGYGAQVILEMRDYQGNIAAPVDGSVISLAFLFNNSAVRTLGE